MDNTNTTKKVKFSELRAMMKAGRIEFDVPGVMLVFGNDGCSGLHDAEMLDRDDARWIRYTLLNGALHELGAEFFAGNPKAAGVVGEWWERSNSNDVKKEKVRNALKMLLGDDDAHLDKNGNNLALKQWLEKTRKRSLN